MDIFMYVEDFLLAISEKMTPTHHLKQHFRSGAFPAFGGLFNDAWHQSFISNVTQHVRAEHALSSNQSRIVLKLIAKARSYLVEYAIASPAEIDRLLSAPLYRRAPYESAQVPREARHIGDNLIALRCKADNVVATNIKALGNSHTDRARFDWSHKLWIVRVQQHNLSKLRAILHHHRFRLDRATTEYLDLCEASIDQSSNFVFADTSQTTMIANICNDAMLAGWITEVAGGIVL
jgi:hypothetical protein